MILSLETATAAGSVALHHQGELVATLTEANDYSHAERLAPMIDQLLREQGIATHQLEAVAVSAGPGSYTGLRIGVSTAKGLCYALDIPLLAVNTLEAMLGGMAQRYPGKWLCPMIDARRMEVYCLLADDHGRIVEPPAPMIIDEHSFAATLADHQIVFFGSGAAKCRAVITSSQALFVEGVHPTAEQVGYLAWQKYLQQDFADTAYFEPEYLKPWMATKAKTS